MNKLKKVDYNVLLDIEKIFTTYYEIRTKIRKKGKIPKFELFLSSNLITIYTLLKDKTYKHGKYNIFLIHEPKVRIIMSQSIYDKIINHLVSY